MPFTSFLPPRLPLMLLVLVALPVSVGRADALDDRRTAAEAEFAQDLVEAAQRAEAEGNLPEAAILRGWVVRRDPGRQVAFIPGSETAQGPEALLALRTARAAQLVELAREYAAARRESEAYRLLCEALREDPNNNDARRILGFRGEPGAWQLTTADGTATQPAGGEQRLGWPGGSYWLVETDHFSVVSNAGGEQAERVAQSLEDLYWVWNQLFFDFTGGAGSLRTAIARGAARPRAIPKMRVVLFANKQQYCEHLERWAPQIEISDGMYREADKTCYLFDDPATRSTWYHEGAHQLFYESGAARPNVAGEANIWLVEGVAIYMESLTPYPGYYAVGGFDADRLQVARWRYMNERYYVPLAQLVGIGSEAIKQRDDVARLYTQSAGLAHFLLDGENGELRGPTIELLKEIYAGRDNFNSLAELTGRDLEQLDADYAAYLNVTDADMAHLKPAPFLGRLCLGHTEVTSVGMAAVAGYDRLVFLDLAYCPLEDAATAAIGQCPNLMELNLEGTEITDEALADLADLSRLQVLDLSQTAITDEGLAHLANLPNLKVLWLTGTQVTDEGLAHLVGLSALEYLNCNDTGVTTAGMGALEEHLPRLNQQP